MISTANKLFNVTNSGSVVIDENGAIHCKRGFVAIVPPDRIADAIAALKGIRYPRGEYSAQTLFRNDVMRRLIAANVITY